MRKRKPLSTMVAESLAEKISSGELAPGMQLPTEAELCSSYEVSRTVIREAMARLRSDGMVVPQQGRGMFVSQTPIARNFSIPDEVLQSLPETIALLELRMSVEVECAGLCAQRRTGAEAAAIRELMETLDAQGADPSLVEIHYDYDFHLAIAKAARNAFMHGFLEYLKPLIVPRHRLGYVVAPERKESYYTRIHKEHDAIVAAIESRAAGAARRAMHKHLQNSLARVRRLAEASGVEAAGAEHKAAAKALFSGFNPGAAPNR